MLSIILLLLCGSSRVFVLKNWGGRFKMSTCSVNDVTEINPLILGGGISGLATAAALEQIAGISSLILEREGLERFQDSKAGAGAQIGPNGLRALKAIGGEELMQQCIASGSVLKGNAMILPGMQEPMVIPDTAEDDTGLPQVFIRWGVLREMLANKLSKRSSVRTRQGYNVCGYESNDENNTIHLVTSDGGKYHRIDHPKTNLIVSAEGSRSIFRYLINAKKEVIDHHEYENKTSLINSELKDTGRVNLKAIVPVELDKDSFLPGYTYAWFAQDGGVGCFAGPAGNGHTYWAISIADSTNEVTGETSQFLGDVKKDDFVTIQSELLRKLRSLNSTDCQFAIDLVKESTTTTTPESIYVSRSVEAVKIGPSLQRDGKVVLVGDSAHAMSGSYGQNPNFALEDAVVLACCLRDSESVEAALESYSEQRVSRCLEMQKRSAERAARAMKGEQVEDVSKWIFQWNIEI